MVKFIFFKFPSLMNSSQVDEHPVISGQNQDIWRNKKVIVTQFSCYANRCAEKVYFEKIAPKV